MFVTSEGHPGARLQRALAAGNLTAAEQAALEIQSIPLADARALVELYAEKGTLLSSDSARLRAPFMPQTSKHRARSTMRLTTVGRPANPRGCGSLVVDRRQASGPSALLPKLRVVGSSPVPRFSVMGSIWRGSTRRHASGGRLP